MPACIPAALTSPEVNPRIETEVSLFDRQSLCLDAMSRLSTGRFLTVLAVAAAAFGPAHAQPVAAAEYRIDRRTIPRGFEGEAAFFERVKWPKEPTGTFQETQAPAWDLKALARYIPPEGIEFADVNHRFEGRVAREAILQSLKERRGAALTAVAHHSHISFITHQ